MIIKSQHDFFGRDCGAPMRKAKSSLPVVGQYGMGFYPFERVNVKVFMIVNNLP